MCHPVTNAQRLSGGARAAWAGAAVLLLATPVAMAGESPNVLEDPWQLSLGGFVVDTDTNVRLDGDTGAGTDVNWEETFGSGDVTRFRIDGHWRFAERHKARFMWFSSSRSKSETIEEDIL